MGAKYSRLEAASKPPTEGNLPLEPCRESTLGVPLLEKSCGNLLLGESRLERICRPRRKALLLSIHANRLAANRFRSPLA